MTKLLINIAQKRSIEIRQVFRAYFLNETCCPMLRIIFNESELVYAFAPSFYWKDMQEWLIDEPNMFFLVLYKVAQQLGEVKYYRHKSTFYFLFIYLFWEYFTWLLHISRHKNQHFTLWSLIFNYWVGVVTSHLTWMVICAIFTPAPPSIRLLFIPSLLFL